MTVEPQTDEVDLRLREQLVHGEIEGEEYSVSVNVDGKAIFVEFDDERVMFSISDMIKSSYKHVFEEE